MDFQAVFQNLGFPVAICAVLGYVLFIIIKHNIRQSDETIKQIQSAQGAHLADLQQQNSKLATIIADNTKAFNELITLIKSIAKC